MSCNTRARTRAPCDNRRVAKRVLLYGVVGGVLIAFLKVIEYKHFIHEYPSELYGGLVAILFTALGIYFGLRWTRPKEIVVVKEVEVPAPAPVVSAALSEPFVLNAERLRELGITQREHEILGLIAEGLSNREIAEKLFVSENTVKTHSSRLFEKMSVNRRMHAVQKAKSLGLIP
ncbi:MAG: DNA-binding response regulator [Acidobacteria bacterium]|nr:DNA-binding response regulator [Acidobacteriota bacterium]MBV9478756.1 DNA-binding response regulator [Acidobacteriota bacterium]